MNSIQKATLGAFLLLSCLEVRAMDPHQVLTSSMMFGNPPVEYNQLQEIMKQQNWQDQLSTYHCSNIATLYYYIDNKIHITPEQVQLLAKVNDSEIEQFIKNHKVISKNTEAIKMLALFKAGKIELTSEKFKSCSKCVRYPATEANDERRLEQADALAINNILKSENSDLHDPQMTVKIALALGYNLGDNIRVNLEKFQKELKERIKFLQNKRLIEVNLEQLAIVPLKSRNSVSAPSVNGVEIDEIDENQNQEDDSYNPIELPENEILEENLISRSNNIIDISELIPKDKIEESGEVLPSDIGNISLQSNRDETSQLKNIASSSRWWIKPLVTTLITGFTAVVFNKSKQFFLNREIEKVAWKNYADNFVQSLTDSQFAYDNIFNLIEKGTKENPHVFNDYEALKISLSEDQKNMLTKAIEAYDAFNK